ncbi:MAG: putative lipid II flippase FtsW [bacterium]|nr:putative lipid II flippase FtsW [Candidatus Sumerlaeota bacterium]
MKSSLTWLIFIVTLTLLTTGVVMVYSSSAASAAREAMRDDQRSSALAPRANDATLDMSAHSFYYLKRQVVWVVLSIIAMLTVYHFIDYERYRMLATPLLLTAIVALALVFVPGIGIAHKGSHRWIGFGGVQIQPSEFAKLAMVLYMAKKLAEKQDVIRSFWRGFIPMLLVLCIVAGLIVIEPDLGASVVIGLICFTMFFVAGMRRIHLATLGILAALAVVAAVIAEPYRVARVFSYLDPEADIHGKGWQLYQSLVAVGSGGVVGLGLGRGPQKYLFLSEAHTDFIFSVICEEMGLIGAVIIMTFYVAFIILGICVAYNSSDMYSSLLATGVISMIGIPAFINVAVVTGLVPTKGLTLPLISYGGSSLFSNMLAIGILMNMSRNVEIANSPSRRPRHAHG